MMTTLPPDRPDRPPFLASPHGWGGVRFGVLWPDGAEGMADWTQELYAVSRHVPGGDRTITQLLGRGPLRVTWRLSVDSVADYRTLRGLTQTTDTLEVSAGMQGVAGEVVMVGGRMVERVPGVMLVGLANAEIAVDGTVEVDATFQRSAG